MHVRTPPRAQPSGEVRDEPALEVDCRDSAHILDEKPLLVVVGGEEGEADVDHEDAVDEDVDDVGRLGRVAKGSGVKGEAIRHVK